MKRGVEEWKTILKSLCRYPRSLCSLLATARGGERTLSGDLVVAQRKKQGETHNKKAATK